MEAAATDPFWKFDTNYWFQKLNSSAVGLSQKTADELFLQSGGKRVTQSPLKKGVLLFLSQFKSPLMLLLIGAVILSGSLGDTADEFIILFIVTSTGLLSFLQERNAGKIVEKLQSMISIKSTVLRDGQPQEIISTQIVPGDILLFKAGDMVPADCLLIEDNELHANESSLTGESYPVRKFAGVIPENTVLAKRTNCLWEGSNVISGNARALVINTGAQTLFGSIAHSASTSVETAFEKGIKDFGYMLLKITLTLSFFILVVNLLNHKSVIDSALFALALAVGMAPELLPAITTIAMSAGAKRMLEKKVIVKKLTSIQNFGEVNLLCTDKTGTITEGTIKVSDLVNGFGEKSDFVKDLACWNAAFETGYANAIDDALRTLEPASKPTPEKLGEIPYDFIRKRLSIAVDTGTAKLLITKGAFTEVLGICSQIKLSDDKIALIASYKHELESRFEQFGVNGLRAIGICYKNIKSDKIVREDENDMIFAGFILLQDPVKAGIIDTINELKKLKVGLKIITGDNKNVAKCIALEIGIKNPVIMSGEDLFNTSPEALRLLVKRTHIFAEVEPQQKERIIHALRHSYTVAYMGDGINDVAAINAADVGISVSNAVDVAREAADFVLIDKDLMVLAEGIREGRKTFSNTLKYIFVNTGSTFGSMCSVAVASLLLPFLPMLPKQILLVNFITDFPYLTIAQDNVDQEQLDKPRKWNLKAIRNYMIIFGIHSSLFDLITFLVLLYVLKVKDAAFQTGWFIESAIAQLAILFIIRTHQNFIKSKPGKYLIILSGVGLLVTIILPYSPFSSALGFIPLPLINGMAMLLIVAAYITTADLLKVWFFRRNKAE
ncbi:MAG: magnesium-translocating P-type ATPase [Mucilaginibacter sp.]